MFWRSICFCHCSAYEATSHSQHSKETTGKFLSVWIFKRPFVFLVPTPINCATEDKCICHVCWWGSHMWTSVLCYFKFLYSFSVFYIHYTSGILEKKKEILTVWNKKQNLKLVSEGEDQLCHQRLTFLGEYISWSMVWGGCYMNPKFISSPEISPVVSHITIAYTEALKN